MYIPPAFREDDPVVVREIIRDARLATLVTTTAEGLVATPLPLYLADEGDHGVLYGHVAKANRQWMLPPIGDALVIFNGPDAYVSPSWYPAKQEHGKVVPTWNYAAVHAYGPVEFFDDESRLREVVQSLTDRHEAARPAPWSIADAPAEYIRGQLRGIVGVRVAISRFEAKRKLSQNRSVADREGVAIGLAQSPREGDRTVSVLMQAGLVAPGDTVIQRKDERTDA